MECINEFCQHFKQSSSFRQKVFYTICLYAVIFSEGWGRGQLGPSLADLQLISSVDLETGSWIVTSFYIGQASGSLTGAFLYDFVNHKLLVTLTQVGVACTYVIIPWCSIFGLMAFVYGLQGFFNGLMESVSTAAILTLWTKHGKTVFMVANFLYCVGGMLSPLATAPFLTDKVDIHGNISQTSLFSDHYDKNTSDEVVTRNYFLSLSDLNENKTSNYSSTTEHASQLYIAYSMSGCLLTLTAVLCMISFCFELNTKKTAEGSDTDAKTKSDDNRTSIPLRHKLIPLAAMTVLACLEVSIDESMLAYSPTFASEYLQWTTTNSALTVSAMFISSLAAAMCSIFVIHLFNTQILVGIMLNVGYLVSIGLTFCSIYFLDIGVWVCFVLYHFIKGNVFVLIFTWTNEYIAAMTGKIVSLYMLSSMAGSAVNPILIGYLMEEVTNLWFCYLMLIEGLVLIVFYFIALLSTRSFVKKYGTVLERSDKEKNEACEMMDVNH